MGIFSRLNRVIKSNLNALIDQAEDPDKMIGQTVADMKSALQCARNELIEAMGTAKRLEKKEKERNGRRTGEGDGTKEEGASLYAPMALYKFIQEKICVK